MKKIIGIIIIALIFFAVGYIIGNKTKNIYTLDNKNEENYSTQTDENITGTYECENWNGQRENIIILDTENMYYMGRKVTYTRNGDVLKVKDISGNVELTIVPNGLMNHQKLFKKIY